MYSMLINQRGTEFWVVLYTERVINVCAALLVAAFYKYRFFSSPQIILFACELEMGMAVRLGSSANVCELPEMFERVISPDQMTS